MEDRQPKFCNRSAPCGEPSCQICTGRASGNSPPPSPRTSFVVRHTPLPRPRIVPDPAAEQRAGDAEARARRDDEDQLYAANATIPTQPGQAFDWLLQWAALTCFTWWPSVLPQIPRMRQARRVMIWHPESGAGKTSLALYMLLRVIGAGSAGSSTTAEIERARGCRFVPERDICPPSVLKRSRLEEALGATVLVLDDMGATGSSDWFRENVRYLLKDRADRGATTWCTTFMTPDQWGDRYDGGNYRRYFMHNPERGQHVMDLAHPEKTL